MSARWAPERVFVYRHPVDMRKQIDGLSALVALELGTDPADRAAYVFVSRCRRRVKVLIWHLNGYHARRPSRETATYATPPEMWVKLRARRRRRDHPETRATEDRPA